MDLGFLQGATAPRESAAYAGNRVLVLALATAVLAILLIHLDTATSLVEIWRRSDTFAHGWVVVPISLWLIWRRRDTLAVIEFEPCYLGIAVIALAGFGWLLATLASVASVAQFSLVLTLQGTVLVVIGWKATKRIAFPLAFLLFAVPVGEFLVPQLMDWTASVTVTAVQLSGVPVYREGNYFVLPTGEWSVVEACSGIRYLAASVMTGTLYAYLTYRSTRRRLAFIALSIAMPIVANWARAYLIVMLGHLSSGRLAGGVDHLIYGWLFFGLVVGLMFWVGSFWREDERPEVTTREPLARDGAARTVDYRAAIFSALTAVAVAGIWPVAAARLESPADGAKRLTAITGDAGWRARGGTLAEWSPRFVGVHTSLQQVFEKESAGSVGVYIAYYQGQRGSGKLVSSENVLATTSDRQWREIAGAPRTFRWGEAAIGAASSELASKEMRLVARRFYWVDRRLTSNGYLAKVWLTVAKLSGRGAGSAAIVLYTVGSDPKQEAEARLDRFGAEMGAAVDRALAAAEGHAR